MYRSQSNVPGIDPILVYVTILNSKMLDLGHLEHIMCEINRNTVNLRIEMGFFLSLLTLHYDVQHVKTKRSEHILAKRIDNLPSNMVEALSISFKKSRILFYTPFVLKAIR